MKQHVFEARHRTLWQQTEKLLEAPREQIDSDFPNQYRALCQQLATAKARRYSPQLVSRLNRLVVGCHQILYQHNARLRQRWLWFLVQGFPATLRRNRVYVVWAAGLFVLPLLLMTIGCLVNSELIYSLMDPASVRQFESMYEPGTSVLGRERSSATDLNMFGFYIYNNISVGFRTFASGIVFGLGSIFFLIFNGLSIGGVAGHLTQLGYTDTFYGFVVGHGALELTAIVLCGAAGLKLGFSLVDPGALRRVDALRLAAREAILIVYGAALMLVMAAFIEAFWSSTTALPLALKYGVGATIAVLLGIYLCRAGRRRGS